MSIIKNLWATYEVDLFVVMGMSSKTFIRRQRNGFLGLGWIYSNPSWRDGSEYLHFDANRLNYFKSKIFLLHLRYLYKNQKILKTNFVLSILVVGQLETRAWHPWPLEKVVFITKNMPTADDLVFICFWQLIYFDTTCRRKKGMPWIGKDIFEFSLITEKGLYTPTPFCVTVNIDRYLELNFWT